MFALSMMTCVVFVLASAAVSFASVATGISSSGSVTATLLTAMDNVSALAATVVVFIDSVALVDNLVALVAV